MKRSVTLNMFLMTLLVFASRALAVTETVIPVGTVPGYVAVNATTNRIYVSNLNSNNISVIDGSTNTVVATVSVGSSPSGIATNSVTNMVYVANSLGNTVSVIDGGSNAVVATIAGMSFPLNPGEWGQTERSPFSYNPGRYGAPTAFSKLCAEPSPKIHARCECLAIEVGQSLKGPDVVRVLQRISAQRGAPQMLFCDNGSEFSSQVMDLWAYHNQVKIDFSRPGKPTDNAHVESFNGTLRAECLDAHWFSHLPEAAERIEAWRWEYNASRPHRALGERTPHEFANAGD